MIDKPKRPKQPSIQERQPPRTLQELVNRYDLDNTKVYDFLDELVGQINENDNTFTNNVSSLQTQINTINQDNITITSDYTIDDNSCFKSQNYVNISINIYNSTGTYSTYSWVKLARLPVGYRPSGEKYISGFGCGSGWSTPTAVPIIIDTNGYINVYLRTSDLKRVIATGIIKI